MTEYIVRIRAPGGFKFVGADGLVQKPLDAIRFDSPKNARESCRQAGIPASLIVQVEPAPQINS